MEWLLVLSINLVFCAPATANKLFCYFASAYVFKHFISDHFYYILIVLLRSYSFFRIFLMMQTNFSLCLLLLVVFLLSVPILFITTVRSFILFLRCFVVVFPICTFLPLVFHPGLVICSPPLARLPSTALLPSQKAGIVWQLHILTIYLQCCRSACWVVLGLPMESWTISSQLITLSCWPFNFITVQLSSLFTSLILDSYLKPEKICLLESNL